MSDINVSSEPAEEAYDDWLVPWQAAIRNGRTALDVGCGPGFDTELLLSWGFTVSACDISNEVLIAAKHRNPHATHLQADARNLSAFPIASFDVVVASLSLHYFDRDDTLHAFSEIARVLRPSGLFAFRVNAHDDHAFGAPLNVHPWELIWHRGKPKQFFTFYMVHDALSEHFTPLVLEKRETHRYIRKKSYIAAMAIRRSVASCTSRLRSVGIDPAAKTLHACGLSDSAEGALEFGQRILAAGTGHLALVKPQSAYFERFGSAGWRALEGLIAIPRAQGVLVLLDAKRGDIDAYVDYANTYKGDSWTILGANVGYEPKGRNWKVYVDVRNLTDENYASSISPTFEHRTAAQITANTNPDTIARFSPGDPLSIFGGFSIRF